MTLEEIEEVLGLFIVAARHARNFPHPELPVERIRAEATLAEQNAERILGVKEYTRISRKYLNQSNG